MTRKGTFFTNMREMVMKRKINLYILLLTFCASGGLLAAHSRTYIIDQDSVRKFTLLTERQEAELAQDISNRIERFVREVGNDGLQELYDRSVADTEDALREQDSMKVMKSRDLATFAACSDSSIKLDPKFVHGFMIIVENMFMFIKISF